MSKPNTIEKTNPPNIAPPKPTYSYVTTFSTSQPSKIISIAGQAGVDPGGILPSTMDEQVKLALDNLRKCLASAGAGPQDVLKITHYIVDYDHNRREWTEQFVDFFEGDPPASTLVPGMFPIRKILGDDLCPLSCVRVTDVLSLLKFMLWRGRDGCTRWRHWRWFESPDSGPKCL